MSLAAHVQRAILAVGVTVISVSIGDPADKTTWVVTHLPSATQADVDAAKAVIAAFDSTDPSLARADADDEVDADDRLADVLEALVLSWGVIGTLTAAGKAPQAVAHVKSAWRAKRRARKGV